MAAAHNNTSKKGCRERKMALLQDVSVTNSLHY
jgi:hypothetical protein